MDIDLARSEPPVDVSEEPWLDESWFDDPWLDRSWKSDPTPPPWPPRAFIPPALVARRQKTLNELGRAVLHLRLFRNWTQRDVELASGVDQTTTSRLERGQQPGLSLHALVAILTALNAGRVHFLPPEGPPPTPLELMLYGDSWKRAGTAADRRLARRRGTSQGETLG